MKISGNWGQVRTSVILLAVLAGCATGSGGSDRSEEATPLETEFPDLPFMRYSVTLRAEVLPILEVLRQQLVDHPEHSVTLVGYGYDSFQSSAENLRLAEERTDVVAAWLEKGQVRTSQINLESKGDDVPPIPLEEPLLRKRANRVVVHYHTEASEAVQPAASP